MKRSTLAAVVVALMLGSGIAGYLIGRPADSVDQAPARTAAAPAPVAPATRPATPATTPTPVTQPVPVAVPSEPFSYRRLTIDSSRPEAEACLAFNKPLATGDVRYADYVRIAPEVKSAVRVVDDKLCVGGLSYGENYTVTLLSGLPGRDGAKLDDERKVDVSLGARPAVVTLPGKGFILPRGTAAGLPITTINVSKVGIAVYRVNERAIDRFADDRYDAAYPGSAPVTESWSLRGWLDGTNGSKQWEGTMDVRNVPNQPIVTAFPIHDTVKDWKPGAYFVVVWNAAKPPSRNFDDDDNDAGGVASGMWVMDTDIALTTFTGEDGLNVFARSLQTAQPIAGLDVVLLTRGNEPVARAVTAADGRVSFARGLLKGKGAAEAFAVMASDASKQEFARLELTKSAFDLSDRGISGRDQPGPVDAFLYTERGVYRPGETVQLMAMLRDNGAVALGNMPVTLIVKRPDGTEFTRFALALPASGALYQTIDLPKSSRRGRWSVGAYIDPKAAPVGRAEFSVEDFVPEKLKVELTSEQPILRTGQVNNFSISADFLYGAPAAGLTAEADMRVTADDQPFADFTAYTFGSEKERSKFEPPFITLTAPDTDAAGKTKLEWGGDKVKDTVLPLRAQIQARVFEPGGGRSTKADKSVPVRTRNVYLGIRPGFDDQYAPEGVDTTFDIVAVDALGKQIARPSVEYRIERIEYAYQWYQVDGRWRWQSIANERVVIADTLALKADQPTRLSRRLSWGEYKLTVLDPENKTLSSTTFYVGWYGGDNTDNEPAPDTLRVASDKQNYKPGDNARLRIEPPFAGEALVVIATDRIVATYPVQVPAGGTTVEIPIKADWGAGAYALVTAWRPLAAPAERLPTRAIGAVWLGIDPALRSFGITVGAPEKVTPRQRIEVPIKVSNFENEEAYVTLAAVDEGILQLTRFKTPNPAKYYFGKRQLGLSMRDDYGRLLDARADDLGRIRTGGDSGEIGGLDIVPTRTVALFSGPVKLDDKGEAKIGLDIPDFIGQLRLMAVAYSKTHVGATEQRLFVRDAVAADVVLPRFLAPGDRGRVALSLHNVDGQAGDYRIALEATGAVALERPVAETSALAANQRELLTWDLKAGEPGFGKVTVSVSGPGNFAVRREWDIQVRAAQTPSAVDTVAQLEPKRALTVDRNLTSMFAAGTEAVSVALSRIPGIDVPGLLRALDKYPFGCIEQTTSRALPLLYYNDVALLGYGPTDQRIPDRVQDAIYRIVDMQLPDGSFGMWGPYSPAAEWLQAYALDFLLRARDQSMAVPAASLSRGLTWLNRNVEKLSPNAQAYGWYVLAKAGFADPGRIRYFQDTKASDIEGGLAWAQLAAALNHVAEPGRARLAFAQARANIDARDPHDYYGSALRNRAAVIALATEAGGREALTEVVNAVREKLVAKVSDTTTQEQAWLVLAARAMGSGTELTYSVDGEQKKAATEPVVLNPDKTTLARGMRVTNDGDTAVWLQVTARGVPVDPQPAASDGLAVRRRFLTLTGEPANLGRLRQNDRLIVSIDGRNVEGGYHEIALLDLLPAGFEIESVLTDDTVKSFPFLDKVTDTRIAEARDDRFFASFNLGQRPYSVWGESDNSFGNYYHVAYIVRAVTPGTFALPAVNVSDMYAPRVYARSGMGSVTIAPR
jgi:uncharacterized protein YfaS (alpha-2-macroglobulin family)